MPRFVRKLGWALWAASVAFCCAAPAQSSIYQRFRSDNASMVGLQPAWLGPVTHPDARLGQALRLSVSNSACSAAHTINYGNGHGISVILDRRFQVGDRGFEPLRGPRAQHR